MSNFPLIISTIRAELILSVIFSAGCFERHDRKAMRQLSDSFCPCLFISGFALLNNTALVSTPPPCQNLLSISDKPLPVLENFITLGII